MIAFVLLGASGCSFKQADNPDQQNSCLVDADCESQHCESGFCVMAHSTTPLNVTLVVTPKRMPDGSQPFPIVAKSFPLQGGNMPFELHLPISVPVNIHDGDTDLDALVSFTPQLNAMAKFAATTTKLNASAATTPGRVNAATLLSDVDYSVVVQPVDTKRPPHSTTVSVTDGASLDVDYAQLTKDSHRFRISNAPSGSYSLRARSTVDGSLISNTQPIASAFGIAATVRLIFDSSEEPYKLELTPTPDMPYSAGDGFDCDDDDPVQPTITFDPTGAPNDASSDTTTVQLPNLQDAIMYTGSIALCPGQTSTSTAPVSFKSAALNFDTPNKNVSAYYETSTMTQYDPNSGQLQFCARLPPGDYVVVATPPANVNCEIFAERRHVAANSSNTSSDPDVLGLRTPARLSGSVVTPDGTPMANASIGLIALGQEGVALAVDDSTVPVYNRSKQATSSAAGKFDLPVDVGTYDVIVKPPAQSNYAWRILYGVEVGSRTTPFTTVVTLDPPVVVTGSLSYSGAAKSVQSTLASAEVHAYTIVDEGQPTARSLEVARGQADVNGNLSLLLPPELQKSWIPQ